MVPLVLGNHLMAWNSLGVQCSCGPAEISRSEFRLSGFFASSTWRRLYSYAMGSSFSFFWLGTVLVLPNCTIEAQSCAPILKSSG